MELVHDLQRKTFDPKISISDLLRMAYMVALNLMDFEQWLNNELNGYKEEKDLPDYRFVTGFMRFYNSYHGWQDVMSIEQCKNELDTAKFLVERVA